MKIKNTIFLILFIIILTLITFRSSSVSTYIFYPKSTLGSHLFAIESIDTMKFSRDLARDKLYDKSFDKVIDTQMKLIAETGATHVAIATPYDEEFILILTRWVKSARAHNLSVWFRGNFSGWENWFNYSKISRDVHKKMLKSFITSHSNLFADGDVFTPCPECENGGPGDPRQTGDRKGYNSFLVDEYKIATDSFNSIHKSVTLYTSMNGDIARDIIDEKTAKALGGVILIDHYVNSAKKFSNDITTIGKKLNAKIGLGEFGGPILDLNGSMNQTEQAEYVESLLDALYANGSQIPAVNYWTLRGGSTALLSENGTPREAYYTVQSYFNAPKIYGTISDPLGDRIEGVTIKVTDTTYTSKSEEDGIYKVFLPSSYRQILIEKEGYKTVSLDFENNLASTTEKNIVLEPEGPSLWYEFKIFLHSIRGKLFINS
ncbi:MAG: hypothetical protein A3E02_01010 [Candidatus Zambryskibacteria bacterium RIFCSPHIGHO2_12_FULL_38_34]|uniref:Carboxypeptidase regulatory-like domain-containing protein n=1 Tax=Candidatus Zambryskibacteria bacterium RIFCSPLOWO2_12_FULL_39_16 TaxID=1802775 RepID=A0A1G2USF2_9BACT|nr:MAG: hypothetical protein A3D37_01865 [Candidatus Zambryskibacteria bacterium RIFCSPHIGHO2_02_FULL_38_22]OHA98040.1 MAG: hypothetical protein A3E02_01010 [Candidatus Zambryskibacteria bacterium RIFCSPHIGHO2_12_FULL_38_34]OHB12335.1 MAG: hypothetical protein A3G46_02015 [Candidatus Zambryskibacteria bacterium RIFCSPLOWO2_12_FULL_39_16]